MLGSSQSASKESCLRKKSSFTIILKDSVTNYCGRIITISSTENVACNFYFY